MRFTIEMQRVDVYRRAEASVIGDVEGTAALSLEPVGKGGTRARLESTLAPANPLLRTVARVARPMVRWGHDWVLDEGRRQFVQQALR